MVAGSVGLSILRGSMLHNSAVRSCRFLGTAFGGAALSLVLAGLMLLSDAGITPALKYLVFASEPSYLVVGTWAIICGIVLCSVLTFFLKSGFVARGLVLKRVLLVGVLLVGFVAALYTGLFLASMKAVPLWNTPWLPALFVLSSLSCGVVSFVALAKACGVSDLFYLYARALIKVDLGLIALEAFCAIAFVWASAVSLAEGPTAVASVTSALNLILGEDAWIWWSGFVGFGLFATMVFDVLMLRAKHGLPGRLWSVLGVLFCVSTGAFTLRYCIIEAGMHPAFGF